MAFSAACSLQPMHEVMTLNRVTKGKRWLVDWRPIFRGALLHTYESALHTGRGLCASMFANATKGQQFNARVGAVQSRWDRIKWNEQEWFMLPPMKEGRQVTKTCQESMHAGAKRDAPKNNRVECWKELQLRTGTRPHTCAIDDLSVKSWWLAWQDILNGSCFKVVAFVNLIKEKNHRWHYFNTHMARP